jgi:hypothetical protein
MNRVCFHDQRAALGQIPKLTCATSSSGVEGLPGAGGCMPAGSLGRTADAGEAEFQGKSL